MARGPFDLGGLTIGALGKRVWAEMSADDVWDAAAQLGYYFMLALFPLMICLLSLVAVVKNVDLVTPFENLLRSVMPHQAFGLIDIEIRRIRESSGGGLLTFGMLGTIWAASSGVSSLLGTLNRAYDVTETRSFIKVRAISISLTFALVVLIIAGAVLLMTGDRIASWAAVLLGFDWIGTVVGTGINYLFGLALLFVGLEIIYYIGPNVEEQKWKWISPGSIVGVLLFVISSVGFSLYVRFNDSYSATYGSIGGMIILMLWLYLLGLSIVMGGEINAEIEHSAKARGEADAPDTSINDQKDGPKDSTARAPGPAEPDTSVRSKRPDAVGPALRPILGATADTACSEDLVLRDLFRALTHENAHVRAGAAMTMVHLGPRAIPAIDALVDRLTDDSLDVRQQAIRALTKIGEPAAPALDRATAGEDPELRRVASQVLATIRRAA